MKATVSKKPAPKSARSHVAPRAFLSDLDPAHLVQILDDHFEDNGDAKGSPYRRLYRQARQKFFENEGRETVDLAALLFGNIDGACLIEDALRSAGFVVGFETCRQLLLGELDLKALKGGAA